ncbi:MAG: ATP-binding protein [Candidatus Jettenia sp.]|nr:ATP-binding protein [Candidatus Jettenia sp.]
MRLYSYLSFKSKLLLFALCISLIPIVAITAVHYFTARSTLKNQILEKLTAIAESKGLHVKHILERKLIRVLDFSTDGFIRRRFERVLRKKDAFTQGRVRRLNEYLSKNKLPLYEHLLAIILVDKQGKVISTSHKKLMGMDFSDQEIFKQGTTKGYGETYISPPQYFSPLRVNCIVASTPIVSEYSQEKIGLIINVYNQAALNKITTDYIGMGETDEVFLVRRDKIMVTESRFIDDASFKQIVDVEPVRRILDRNEEMIGIYQDYMNVSVVGISRSMPKYGLILLAETHTTEAFAPLRALSITTITLLVVGTVLVTLVGISFATLTSEPIKNLTEAAKKISDGSFGYKVRIQRRDEIGILADSFNTMSRELAKFIAKMKRSEKELLRHSTELKRSNEELQHFAYVASHDLQEPLRMISSYLQLIERRYRNKLDTDAEEFITYAVDGANRLQTMINGLLEYSRVDSRGKSFELIDCETLFERALLNLEVTIKENNTTITHDTLPTVMADSSQLLQVFQNLISNAIKFHGTESPRIHISARRNENEWIFSVHDNGIGIEQEYTKQLFNIFKRLHGREYPGIGLGLSICKKIINRHNGRIWLESEPGKGSTFYFTIPVQRT